MQAKTKVKDEYPLPPRPKPTPHPHKVEYVVEYCVAFLRGLPNKRDRSSAIGQIIAVLNHSGHLDGIMNVINESTNAINRYTAPIEARGMS